MTRNRSLPAIGAAILLTLALTLPAAAAESHRATLERYASDTWRSFVHLVEPRTGLPADNIAGSLKGNTRSEYTSPTNIGMYMWAVLAARDLGLISADEAVRPNHEDAYHRRGARAARTVRAILELVLPADRREAHGVAGRRKHCVPIRIERG